MIRSSDGEVETVMMVEVTVSSVGSDEQREEGGSYLLDRLTISWRLRRPVRNFAISGKCVISLIVPPPCIGEESRLEVLNFSRVLS